jgi:hypothetical protein
MKDWLEKIWFKLNYFYWDYIYEYTVQLVKNIYQVKKYGCKDEDTWSLDITVAEYILPRLKRFKSLQVGYPEEFRKPKQWNDILDQIILTFEMIKDEDKYVDWKAPQKEFLKQLDVYNKTIEKGLKLFIKYFRALWS